MVAKLGLQEEMRIRAAIELAEKRSSIEIVAAFAERSHDYRAFTIAFALAFGVMTALFTSRVWPELSHTLLLLVQGGAFLAMFLLGSLLELGVGLAPKRLQQEAAERHARAQFAELGVANTVQRNGVLIFVSKQEHYAEILTDCGWQGKVAEDAFAPIVERMVVLLRKGRVVDAFSDAATECATLAAKPFPPTSADANELPDAVASL